MRDVFHTAVIGAGPMGSATVRHLSDEIDGVALIGPDDALDFTTHDGPWSGWADEGRALATVDLPILPALVSLRSARRFAALEAATGIAFTRANPSLTVSPNGTPVAGPADTMVYDPTTMISRSNDLGLAAEWLTESALAARFPEVTIPAGHQAVLEPDAMLINPRRLVAAQTLSAQRSGATRIVEEALSWRRDGDAFEITLRSQAVVRARNLVLAAGAYLNLSNLTPKPLAMGIYGLPIVLLRVDADDIAFPTILGKITSDSLAFGGIISPPTRYPDGSWYVKIAGNGYVEMTTREEMDDWVRSGGDPAMVDEARATMRALLPEVRILDAVGRPCILTINDNMGYPYVGVVEPGVVVVTEGVNGVSMSDESGRLAARLVVDDGVWLDTLPEALFAPQYRDGTEARGTEQELAVV